MAMQLEGRVALVTGSDSGIGQATAIEFAREGADVVVTYRSDRAGADRTRVEVERLGRRALVLKADVADEASVEALFDRALESFGKVDILVNNAGVNGTGTPLVDMDTETWDRAMRTNLYGYFFCARRFARERRAAGGGGRIVNITSIHAEAASPGNAEYDTTKGGQLMLTRTLALELAPLRINVNAIGPGMILTPMNQESLEDPAVARQHAEAIPWRRAGSPREVARLAVYLASDDADYVTGESIYIDGGFLRVQARGA
ncbi:MAG TPA: glucose 1-dehydrogenase [Clostridia bacterium]|nr:glucose 1-dehydrogenase [Clostridia bacterium]